MLGWRYEVADAPSEVLVGNVRWLSAYNHPRHRLADTATALLTVFATPAGLINGAGQVGDPIAVLPVLYHLFWQHELHVDLRWPLHPDAVVTTVAA
jgi:hypothetical protein